MSQLTAIPFGIVAGDDENYTVEIVSVKVEKFHKYQRARTYPHKLHNRYKTCCWKSTTTHAHKIKIISRYSHSFVKALGIPKPGNHRNHAIITRSEMLVSGRKDINRVTAYVNVMEKQIQKDIQESIKSKKLVKRSAMEIYQLKQEKYPDMSIPIYLNSSCRNDDNILEDEPSSPVFSTPRMKKKYHL